MEVAVTFQYQFNIGNIIKTFGVSPKCWLFHICRPFSCPDFMVYALPIIFLHRLNLYARSHPAVLRPIHPSVLDLEVGQPSKAGKAVLARHRKNSGIKHGYRVLARKLPAVLSLSSCHGLNKLGSCFRVEADNLRSAEF